jgi:hypothetical protein
MMPGKGLNKAKNKICKIKVNCHDLKMLFDKKPRNIYFVRHFLAVHHHHTSIICSREKTAGQKCRDVMQKITFSETNNAENPSSPYPRALY